MRKRLGAITDARLVRVINDHCAATGGLETWAQTDQINGKAIATILDQHGSQTYIDQKHRIFLGEQPAIEISGIAPLGTKVEKMDPSGQVSIVKTDGKKTVEIQNWKAQFDSALNMRLLLQAVISPAALLGEEVNLDYLGTERVAGRLCHKIGITGGLLGRPQEPLDTSKDLMVVWIDVQENLVSHLWLRYHTIEDNKTLGYLAANVSDYRSVSSQLILPFNIEYVFSDKYQQFHRKHYLVMEFSQWQGITEDKGMFQKLLNK